MEVSPKISFLICTRNRAEIVRECVMSLLESSRHDFEVIVRDNRSTDNTIELLNNINDDRFKVYVSPENQGTLTFYEASKLASGEIVTWLSDEDSFQFSELDYVICQFENNPACNVMFGSIVVGEKARKVIFNDALMTDIVQAYITALSFSGCGGLFIRRDSLPLANNFRVNNVDDAYYLWNYYPVGFFASRCLSKSMITTSRIMVVQTRFARTTNNWSEIKSQKTEVISRVPHYYPEAVYDRLISNLVNVFSTRNSLKVKLFVSLRLICIYIRSSSAHLHKDFILLLQENYNENVIRGYIDNVAELGMNNRFTRLLFLAKKIFFMPFNYTKTKSHWLNFTYKDSL